jgi:uncharacterized protein with ParB-like and HNH nuclease domain
MGSRYFGAQLIITMLRILLNRGIIYREVREVEYLQTIQKIFQDQLFSVPDYQRGYAWEERNWQDLWDDVELLDKGQEHYTGTLVIHPASDAPFSDDNGDEFTRYDIVDGQQRLTTLSILMIEMIRQFESLGGKNSAALRSRYIATTKDGVPEPKLRLNRDTNDYYRKCIISVENDISARPKIFSEQRLYEAQQFFRARFEDKKLELGGGFAEWLDETRAKIVSQMKLTVYLVPKESDVGVIFEVMNNRGKPLTEMEKVKNYLLFICAKLTDFGGHTLSDEINAAWKYIYETLMENDAFDLEDNLLRFNWIATQNYKQSEWKGCNSIKAAFSLKGYRGDYETLRDHVRDYVDNLRKSCKAYCDIVSPHRDKAFDGFSNAKDRRTIIEYSQKLVRLNTTASFVPLLIALRLKNNDPQQYLAILKLCEIYAFRVFAMMGKRTNAGQSALYRSAYLYFHDEWDIDSVGREIKWYLTNYCSSQVYENEIDTIGDWYNWGGIKYLLFEYEMYLAAGANVHLDWRTFQKKDKKDTIEHILPQTPTKGYWISRWSAGDIAEVTHDIGNLVVTLDNSSYGNKGFDEKKGEAGTGRCYANSALFSERELNQYGEWTRLEFEIRRNKISEWMKERWFIEDYVSDENAEVGEVDFDVDDWEVKRYVVERTVR